MIYLLNTSALFRLLRGPNRQMFADLYPDVSVPKSAGAGSTRYNGAWPTPDNTEAPPPSTS